MFVCECGKKFEKIRQMTGHQKNCQVHKNLKLQEKESRRLPNGMFKCEQCGKEHDGSYASGRFCSKHCAQRNIALRVDHVALGLKRKGKSQNHEAARAIYGRWKCDICNEIFNTRAMLMQHKHISQHKLTCKGRTLSKEHKQKIRQSILNAVKEGRITGHAKTQEKETIKCIRQRNAALNRTTPSVCKRTEPYLRLDGTIVNLDSSYERTLAKLFDEHKIKWIRPKPLIWIDKENIQHHYFPDFYLEDYDVYLDPKNDYCFKVQKEKIDYVKIHYSNCYFLTKDQLTWEFINKLLEQYRSGHTGAAC